MVGVARRLIGVVLPKALDFQFGFFCTFELFSSLGMSGAHVPDPVLLQQMENSGNSEDATALRFFNNVDEALMFLNPGESGAPSFNGMHAEVWSILHRPGLVASAFCLCRAATASASPMHDLGAQT